MPAKTATLTAVAAVAAVLGSAITTTGPASAQVELPCNTARLIVPWNPGGDTDIVMRAVVDAANRVGAEPQLQVVNIGGQGGTQGSTEALSAAPDGCTLLALHESMITSFLTGRVDYTWDAFEPIALMAYTPSIIGARKDAPFNNLDEMIARAKEAPQSINTGATLGSNTHFLFIILEDETGIRLNYVPYEGTRDRITALLSGNVDVGEMNIITAQQYLADGSLKAIGIATEDRDPLLPELPTLKEQGVNLIYGTNRGVFAPEGTPQDVIEYWEAIFEKASQDPQFIEALSSQGTQVKFLAADDYEAFMSDSLADHKKAAVNLGLIEN